MSKPFIQNPYRPGAGHMPPHLAGRAKNFREFDKIIAQKVILDNLIVTGLRGVGKTVLQEKLKPVAQANGWLWVGSDLSESASISEENLATRLLTDLAIVSSDIVMETYRIQKIGFQPESEIREVRLNYQTLRSLYEQIPGLTSDKLKEVLTLVWTELSNARKIRGIIFAYDEAQNLSDHVPKEQYPLSVLLDSFQSLQRKEYPLMLLLVGLPTLFPRLVEARTFAERMFTVMELNPLDEAASKEAIRVPVRDLKSPKFSNEAVDLIVRRSGGYPYFIQFICRESFDALLENSMGAIPIDDIINKLDSDFFAGRWSNATDRQRDLLLIIAQLDLNESEFTVQEIVEKSKTASDKPFSPSHVNQMLTVLAESGLIFKNRHGKYSFAVPLMNQFILRKMLPYLDHDIKDPRARAALARRWKR